MACNAAMHSTDAEEWMALRPRDLSHFPFSYMHSLIIKEGYEPTGYIFCSSFSLCAMI